MTYSSSSSSSTMPLTRCTRTSSSATISNRRTPKCSASSSSSSSSPSSSSFTMTNNKNRNVIRRRNERTKRKTNATGAAAAASAVEEEEEAKNTTEQVPTWAAREFTEEGRVFTETFPIRFDEVGPNKLADMGTMARISQECACNHAQGLWGRSQSMPEDMRKVDMAWVCTRLHLDIFEYPKWGDQVVVKTWFESQGRVAARRDWDLVNNETEKRVGKATSQWIAFNLKTRRMGRIPSQVVEDFQLQQWCNEPIMGSEYEVEKLPDARDIGAIEGSQCSVPVVHYTRRSDLDMNGHVNNCIYTEWLLESVPQSYRDEYELKELIIEFKAECNFGDVIEAVCCEDTSSNVGDSVFLAHTLTKKSDEKQTEVVRARTIWAKR